MAQVEKLRAENGSLTNLRAEHARLRDDFRVLWLANAKLKEEYTNMQGDYKKMRGEHHALKLKQTQGQGEMAECRHQVRAPSRLFRPKKTTTKKTQKPITDLSDELKGLIGKSSRLDF